MVVPGGPAGVVRRQLAGTRGTQRRVPLRLVLGIGEERGQQGPTAADREAELSLISASREPAASASGMPTCQRRASRRPQRAVLWSSDPITGRARSRTAVTTSRAWPCTSGLSAPVATTSIVASTASSSREANLPRRVPRVYCWISPLIWSVARARSGSRLSLSASSPRAKRWKTGLRRSVSQPRIIWKATRAAADTGSSGVSWKSRWAWTTVAPHPWDRDRSRLVLPDCRGPSSATTGCRWSGNRQIMCRRKASVPSAWPSSAVALTIPPPPNRKVRRTRRRHGR